MANPLALRSFSSTTIRAIERAGIRILGPVAVPSADGSCANSETAWSVDDNGTGRLLTFRQVLEAAR